MIAGCGDVPSGDPSEDPRDALIREQARLIAAQAEQIAALEATVAGAAGAGDAAGTCAVPQQRELLDASALG